MGDKMDTGIFAAGKLFDPNTSRTGDWAGGTRCERDWEEGSAQGGPETEGHEESKDDRLGPGWTVWPSGR